MAEEPLAWGNVPLYRHLALTARYAAVFRERLCGAKSICRDHELLLVAALLHDIGKASDEYQQRCRAGGRCSFALHEHVGAAVAYLGLRRCLGEEDALVVAASIARHHSADPSRRLWEVLAQRTRRTVAGRRRWGGGGDESLGRVLRALQSLDCGAVEHTVSKAAGEAGVDTGIAGAVGEGCRAAKKTMATAMALGGFIGRLGLSTAPKDLLARVYRVTGFLVVADNIAAACEGRETDDARPPEYTVQWMSELGLECRGCL